MQSFLSVIILPCFNIFCLLGRNLFVSWCNASVVNFYVHLYLICECWKFYQQTLKLCLIVWLPTFISLFNCLCKFFWFLWFWGDSSSFSSHRFLAYNPHFVHIKESFASYLFFTYSYKRSYKLQVMDKINQVIKLMRWKAFF